jgi:hypothetical protein
MVNKEPDNLGDLLHRWTELPAPARKLDVPVWQRIEARGARFSWSERMIGFLGELDLRFARPQAMAALIAVALLLGLGLAELRTRYDVARVDAEMSARYLALLEPAGR